MVLIQRLSYLEFGYHGTQIRIIEICFFLIINRKQITIWTLQYHQLSHSIQNHRIPMLPHD